MPPISPNRLEAERIRLCSAVSLSETVAGLVRTNTYSVPQARTVVQRFVSVINLQIVGIGQREYDIATDAHAQFGSTRQWGITALQR
jgi:ribonuclease VapC